MCIKLLAISAIFKYFDKYIADLIKNIKEKLCH